MSRDILQCDDHGEFLACGPHYSCPECWEAKNTIMKTAEAEILSARYALVSSLFKAISAGMQIQVRQDDTDGSMIRWVDFEARVSAAIDVQRPEYYRVKPQPVLRPWKGNEAPKVVIIRRRGETRGVAFVCFLMNAATPGVFFYQSYVPTSCQITMEEAFSEFVRLHEDGTEGQCGVTDIPL